MKTRSTFRRCAFRPGGRFRNHLILAIRNAVGQLALGEDVARNVLVIGGVVAQPGDSVVWIENNDRLAEILAHDVDGTDEVRVSADQNKNVGLVMESVHQHRRGDVDVGTLFFQLDDTDHAVASRVARLAGVFIDGHPSSVFAVEALNDLNLGKGGKRLKVNLLMVKGGGVMRIGLDGSREVLDGLNRVVVAEKGLNQLNGVEPLVRRTLTAP